MIYEADSILVKDVCKYFYSRSSTITALQNINLSIGDGEFFCIVGPSGCGKTTLLRILAGLESASSGEVVMKYTSNCRPTNSMVFQEQSVFPWMTTHDTQIISLIAKSIDEYF
jgi:NitT/TauT family transport system ATP-binding protein